MFKPCQFLDSIGITYIYENIFLRSYCSCEGCGWKDIYNCIKKANIACSKEKIGC